MTKIAAIFLSLLMLCGCSLPTHDGNGEPLQKAHGWQLPWNVANNYNDHYSE